MLKITLRTGPLLLAASLLRAGTCAPDTLANYELLPPAGCSVGGIAFSVFSFSSMATGVGSTVAASAVMVMPTTTNGEQGLMFSSAGFSVTGMGTQTDVITYTEDPSDDIRSMDDVLDDPVSGGAVARVDSVGCLNAAFSGATCSTSTVSIFVQDNGTLKKTDSANFTPVHILGVQHTLSLTSPAMSSSASITDFGGQSFVPEPSTVWLAALPVLGLVLAGKTRLKGLRVRLQRRP